MSELEQERARLDELHPAESCAECGHELNPFQRQELANVREARRALAGDAEALERNFYVCPNCRAQPWL